MSAQASLSDRALAATSERARGAPTLALRYAGFALCALLAVPFAHRLAWLCTWLALSNLILAYAYATNRVAVFGKRPDGTLAPLCVVLLLPYLVLVSAFFLLKLAGLRREPCFHRAAERIYLGRRPRRAELPPDCRMVIDLTCEFVAPRNVVAAGGYRCLPILNRHVPSDLEFEALLSELLDFDGTIYVHCGAGRGRSAMLVAALLVLRGHCPDVELAERTLKALRPGVQLHPAQKALIARSCYLLRRDVAWQSRSQSATTRCA